jgi:hypothetical protein
MLCWHMSMWSFVVVCIYITRRQHQFSVASGLSKTLRRYTAPHYSYWLNCWIRGIQRTSKIFHIKIRTAIKSKHFVNITKKCSNKNFCVRTEILVKGQYCETLAQHTWGVLRKCGSLACSFCVKGALCFLEKEVAFVTGAACDTPCKCQPSDKLVCNDSNTELCCTKKLVVWFVF